LGADQPERVLARIQVEDELLLREAGDAAEERLAVTRVVERAEERRRGDPGGGGEAVDLTKLDRSTSSEALLCRRDHGGARVYAEIPEAVRKQELGEPAVAAGEIEHRVAGLERRAERAHQLPAVGEIPGRIGISLVTPALCVRRSELLPVH